MPPQFQAPPGPPPPPGFDPAGVGSPDAPWWKQWWIVGAVGGVVLVAVLAIGFSTGGDDAGRLLSSGGDDTTPAVTATTGPATTDVPVDTTITTDVTAPALDDPPPTSPATTAEPTVAPTEPRITKPDDTVPTSTNPNEINGAVLPMGDPDRSTFSYEESFTGAAWSGLPFGLVEVERNEFNDEAGRCVLLIGTITPTSARGAVSSGFDTPVFSLTVDGRTVTSTAAECEPEPVEEAGYDWILDAEVTVGTTYPFHVEFFLPGADDRTIDAVVVGNLLDDEEWVYEPLVLSEIPVPEVEFAESGQTLVPVGDPEASAFTYDDDISGTTWAGVPYGLVDTGTGGFNDEPGRCVTMIGTVTPTSLTAGTTTSGFDTPRFTLISEGRVIQPSGALCDVDEVADAGYEWILDAEVTVGTDYPFHVEFFLPGADGDTAIETVTVGNPSFEDAVFYEPTVLEEIPPP